MIIDGIPLWVASTTCWIVSVNHKECVLIDVPPDPQAVVDRIIHWELTPVAIIATHGHADHVGGISAFVNMSANHFQPTGLPTIAETYIHPLDRHMLDDPKSTSSMLRLALEATGFDFRPPEVIIDLQDGDSVSGAGMKFMALHTPGHTQGSVCIQLEIEGQPPILFSGDHLFRGSIGRTDLPGGSYSQLMESMATKILPLADDTVVLPGHGDPTTIGNEKKTNQFLQSIL